MRTAGSCHHCRGPAIVPIGWWEDGRSTLRMPGGGCVLERFYLVDLARLAVWPERTQQTAFVQSQMCATTSDSICGKFWSTLSEGNRIVLSPTVSGCRLTIAVPLLPPLNGVDLAAVRSSDNCGNSVSVMLSTMCGSWPDRNDDLWLLAISTFFDLHKLH